MASTTENNANPDTSIGLSFPLGFVGSRMFNSTQTVEEQARHNLRNLVLTQVGERVGQPEFGSRLRELCFEQQNDELPVKLEEEVRRATGVWLPYINIQEVNTLTEEGDKNKIFVEVKFSTTLNPQTMESITLDASYGAALVVGSDGLQYRR